MKRNLNTAKTSPNKKHFSTHTQKKVRHFINAPPPSPLKKNTRKINKNTKIQIIVCTERWGRSVAGTGNVFFFFLKYMKFVSFQKGRGC
jgi:hypothetical protein